VSLYGVNAAQIIPLLEGAQGEDNMTGRIKLPTQDVNKNNHIFNQIMNEKNF
jgi:hypothetical protein